MAQPGMMTVEIVERKPHMLTLILLVFAFVLFVLAAVPVASRYNLIAAGLACYVASQLVGAWIK